MSDIDGAVLRIQASALAHYRKTFKNAKTEAIQEHICDTLRDRLQKALPDSNIYVYSHYATIYLHGKDNVGKTVELAFEEHEDFLKTLFHTGEFVEHSWNGDATMVYKWENYSIDVHVSGSSTCKRVKVDTKTRTITEDVYDIVCD